MAQLIARPARDLKGRNRRRRATSISGRRSARTAGSPRSGTSSSSCPGEPTVRQMTVTGNLAALLNVEGTIIGNFIQSLFARHSSSGVSPWFESRRFTRFSSTRIRIGPTGRRWGT
jgi:hypothetical protein